MTLLSSLMPWLLEGREVGGDMRVVLASLHSHPTDIAELDRDKGCKGTLPESWLPLRAPVKKDSMLESCLSLMLNLKDLQQATGNKDGEWERAAHTFLTREPQQDWLAGGWPTAAVIGHLHRK